MRARYYSDDPVADAERYIADQDRELMKRPKCDCCCDHIQEDSALHYGDLWLCKDCIARYMEYIEEEEV